MKRCPQCGRKVTVTEPSAFNGRDKSRSTLSCGHVVLKAHVHDFDPVVEDRPLPDWVFEQAAARRAAGHKMRGLITIIPDEFAENPEVWAAQNGLV